MFKIGTFNNHIIGQLNLENANKHNFYCLLKQQLKRYTNYLQHDKSEKFLKQCEKILYENQNLNAIQITDLIDLHAQKNNIQYKLNKYTERNSKILQKIDSKLSQFFILDAFSKINNQSLMFSEGLKSDVKLKDNFRFQVKTKHGNTFDRPYMQFTIYKYQQNHILQDSDYILFVRSLKQNNKVLFQFVGALKSKQFFQISTFRPAGTNIKIGFKNDILKKDDFVITSSKTINSLKFLDFCKQI